MKLETISTRCVVIVTSLATNRNCSPQAVWENIKGSAAHYRLNSEGFPDQFSQYVPADTLRIHDKNLNWIYGHFDKHMIDKAPVNYSNV